MPFIPYKNIGGVYCSHLPVASTRNHCHHCCKCRVQRLGKGVFQFQRGVFVKYTLRQDMKIFLNFGKNRRYHPKNMKYLAQKGALPQFKLIRKVCSYPEQVKRYSGVKKYIDRATGGRIAVKSIIFILSPDLTSVSFRTWYKGMCYEFLRILIYRACFCC